MGSTLSAILESLGVALLAYGVMALLLSHGRYRRRLLLLEAKLDEGVDDDSLRFAARDVSRRGELIWLLAPELKELPSFWTPRIRRYDRVFLRKDGGLCFLFASSSDRLPALQARFVREFPPETAIFCGEGLEAFSENLQNPHAKAPQAEAESVEAPPEYLDELTGLPNAELFGRSFRTRLSSARRRGRAYSLLCLQVEGLEWIEERQGEEASRELRKWIGKLLLEQSRQEDLPALSSEGCFWLGLELSEDEARSVAERLLEYLVKQSPEHGGSFSIGLASSPKHARGPLTLMERAELAAQKASESGRGRLLLWDMAWLKADSTEPQAESVDRF